MDPLRYLTALRRRWWLIVALTALGLLVGFASGSSSRSREGPRERSFVATHTLAVLDPVTPSRQRSGAPQATDPELDAIPALLASGDVPRRAAALLGGGEDPAELAARVESSSDTALGTLSISVTHRSADRAVAIADAFTEALLEHLTAEQVEQAEAQKAALQQVLDGLEPEINRLNLEAASDPSLVQETQLDVLLNRYASTFEELQALEASPPASGLIDLGGATAERTTAPEEDFSTPSSRTGRAAIGGLAGLLVGAVLALVIDRLDTSIRSAEAAEAALGMPVLVSVPALPRKLRRGSALPALGSAPDFDEALRLLRSMLMVAGGTLLLRGEARVVMSPGEPSDRSSIWRPVWNVRAGGARPDPWPAPQLRTLLVTSANASEGRSTLVAGLGRTMGLAPSRVIILDLDLRRPAQHRLLEGPVEPGIADLFAAAELMPGGPGVHDGTPRPLDDILVEAAPGVRLAPAGTDSAPTHLLSAGAGLVHEARTRGDIVLIDAPPLLAVSEASELLPAIDGVVVAVFAGRTTVADAMALSERLALLGAPVVGAVLVGGTAPSRSRRAKRRFGPGRAERAPHPDEVHGTDPPVTVEEATGIGSR